MENKFKKLLLSVCDSFSDFLFVVLIFLYPELKKINTPDLRIECPDCGKRTILLTKNNGGFTCLCLSCFSRWTKPPLGSMFKWDKKLNFI